ncbi:MAG: serine/threonine protein kinase, partial [Deltaproteobacteria bacterium]|nr:serine/threonine protein kinase [Deltaproteobacteria bacterium]
MLKFFAAMDSNEKISGRYDLIRMIGSGGMGEIYLASMRGPHGFEKKVVLKKIHQHLSRDEEFIKRFIDEGKLVVNLNHANIVQVLEMGIENGEYFLAMEYVDGVNLNDFLYGLRKEGAALPVELAVFILIEVLKGLSYAHTKTDENGQPMGIIHRDISPVNIMISRDGEVKLLDFGVARAKSRMSQSLPGVLHGKFLYLSPEQARGEELDFRSDIFSFGVTAYELITGTRPFDGQTDIEILDKIKNFNPPAVLQPSFSGELAGIVMKCLEKDPEKRYGSTAELEEAFVNYLYRTHTIVGRKELQEFVKSRKHLFPAAREGGNGFSAAAGTPAGRK